MSGARVPVFSKCGMPWVISVRRNMPTSHRGLSALSQASRSVGRSGFNRPLRPTLRLAWDSALRPRWLVGMFLRTLITHGMPHFENTGTRAPLITNTAERYTGPRDKLSWPHVELMRKMWKGRLVLKGVLDPQDARIARESGVDGVIVSNHGGRQLDGSLAPLHA